MNNIAITAAAKLVDQINALTIVRDQAIILQQAGQKILTVTVADPIAGDNGVIGAQIATTVDTSMATSLNAAFATAIDTTLTALNDQLQQQVDLINQVS